MASRVAKIFSDRRKRPPGGDLLVRETNHRWSNDLQLVVSLLALQGRRAANLEVRQALADAMERVSIVLRARKAMYLEQHHNLETALRHVCEALSAQAELRSISISLEAQSEVEGLSERHITTLALVVNELTTNAIKHAFEDGKFGHICVSVRRNRDRGITVIVDDDGLPFAEAAAPRAGLGMELAKRLMTSIGGVLIPPPLGTKAFELRVPAEFH